jgi:lactate racemase
MKSISLKYGDEVLPLRLPDSFRVDILSPRTIVQSKGDESVIESAMNSPIATPPLHRLVEPGINVAVIVDDLTRPTPIARMLPVLLRQLAHAGLSRNQIKIVVALGTHRPLTGGELQKKLGGTICSDYAVVNVDCQDRSQFLFMGNTSGGVPAWINRTVSEADLRIGLGMIVPHTDTGFSGGAKIVLPGVCAHDTITAFHMRQVDGPPVRIGNETAPLRLELERFVAEKIPLDFILNVVIDVDEKIYDAVAGHHVDAHRKGCRAAEKVYGLRVEKPYPIVIADAYPTQNDLWQSTKAVSGAAAITAAGGRLILLAHSPEGVANHPAYAEYIGQTPETLKQMMADKALQDPVACALAYDISRLRKNFRISLVSHGLTKTDAGRMKFDYFETLEAAVESAHVETGGSDIAILTHGGISWPYLGRSDAG